MSEDFVTRDEFTEHQRDNSVAIEGIRSRVDEIRESQIKIEASSLRIETFGNKIFEVMYGRDDKGGLISTVQKWSAHTKLHWAILIIILSSIIGLFFKR